MPLHAPRKRRGAKELAALKRAEAARKSRAKNRAGAIAAGLSAAGVLGMLALAAVISFAAGWNLGLWIFVAALFTAGPLAALTAFLASRASARSKEIPAAIDEAWMAAATDVVEQSSTAVTAGSLAEALRIEEAQAEELLALLEASDLVRPDGNHAYRARLRVATPSAATANEDLAAEAEAQAEAEAEAMAREQKRERL
ncbi:MAG: hypothetical protein IPM54_33710 [Polyangiaceae bacterium]|nr:hypothetical protein [Polyangiaceae bacterium]